MSAPTDSRIKPGAVVELGHGPQAKRGLVLERWDLRAGELPAWKVAFGGDHAVLREDWIRFVEGP